MWPEMKLRGRQGQVMKGLVGHSKELGHGVLQGGRSDPLESSLLLCGQQPIGHVGDALGGRGINEDDDPGSG